MRLYDEYNDKDNDKTPQEQREAVGDILEKLTSKEFISSRFQVKQFDGMHEDEQQDNKKGAILAAKATCEETCPQSTKTHPYCRNEVQALIEKTGMNDKEDAWHIVIAWIKGADYFITTDRELYETKKNAIEKVLAEIGPPPGVEVKNIQILDPRDFIKIL